MRSMETLNYDDSAQGYRITPRLGLKCRDGRKCCQWARAQSCNRTGAAGAGGEVVQGVQLVQIDYEPDPANGQLRTGGVLTTDDADFSDHDFGWKRRYGQALATRHSSRSR